MADEFTTVAVPVEVAEEIEDIYQMNKQEPYEPKWATVLRAMYVLRDHDSENGVEEE